MSVTGRGSTPIAERGASARDRLGQAAARRRRLALRSSFIAVLAAAVVVAAPATGFAEGGSAAVSWGSNYPHEQLGAGFGDNYELSPVAVVGLTSITAMASAADSSFALHSNGTVSAWGGNDYGQLGDGSHEQSGTPVAVAGLPEEVTAIAAAGVHALALLKDGEVMAWGTGNFGELGNGKSGLGTDSLEPEKVPGLKGVTAIAAGGASDFAVEEDGAVMAWGRNSDGMLGLGESGPECKGEGEEKPCFAEPRPVKLEGLPEGVKVTAVAAGEEAAYALLSNGTVMAWGDNAHGQLGTGNTANTSVPVRVCAVGGSGPCPTGPYLENVTAISGGDIFALALLNHGEVVAWGSNGNGELGGTSSEECKKNLKTCQKIPKLVSGLEGVTAVSAGGSFSLALSGGTIYAFGDNEGGQLGIGGTSNTNVPTAIKGISNVGGIAAGTGPSAGEAHSLAFLQSGSAPPPLLSLTPEEKSKSLTLVWTVGAKEKEPYKLRWRPWSAGETGKWSKLVEVEETCSPEKACSYTTPALNAQAYEVTLNVGGKVRKIIGTP